VGGLGLFLLGMVVMTDGLRAVAGDALGRTIFRFTRTPLSGAVSGAAVTAVLQSSSATTVATVGFVSAGLLSFSQALGVLFGANIGTTVTGWLVALLGFKLDLGTVMLPVVLAGVLLRLFGRGRLRHAGWAAAGFAVLFLGIDLLRTGMAGYEGVVTPANFPDDTIAGRLRLVGLGVLVTMVTQSSSAGVATALAALHAQTIAFPQAAALVIGMDVGTTATALLATIGGSTQTRRTGLAHVVYNLFTGLGALLLLTPYRYALDLALPGTLATNPELALVGFHTTFNTLGVLLVLPVTHGFARLMTRLVPERGEVLEARLDDTLLVDPPVALLALWGTIRDLTRAVFAAVARTLGADPPSPDESTLPALEGAIDRARRYADRIRIPAAARRSHPRHLPALHCLDHLDRLVDRARQFERPATIRHDARLHALAVRLCDGLDAVVAPLAAGEPTPDADVLAGIREATERDGGTYRMETLAAVGETLRLDAAVARLDAMRWLQRVAYHAWRITHHLHEAEHPEQPPAPASRRAEVEPTATD
jgi:phosphate:Na+ symporter